MGRYIVATHRADITRDWLCARCNAYGVTTVSAVGQGEKRLWFSRSAAADVAHDHAAADLEHDADRIVSLVPCPKCRSRAPGAVARTLLHGILGLWPAVMVSVFAYAFMVTGDATVLPIIAAVGAFVIMIAAGDARRRWMSASRARVYLSAAKPPRPAIEPVRTPQGPVSADPFRAPPGPAPLVVVQPTIAAKAVPIVESESAEQPSFLR
jgi:hypothetical protein